jgi:hypothetical protein
LPLKRLGDALKFVLILPVRPFIWLYQFLWMSIRGMFQGQYLFASARLFLALFSAFLMIGIPFHVTGLIFGFDGLALIDRWLNRHGVLISSVGDLIFRMASGILFLICLMGVVIVIRGKIASGRSAPRQRGDGSRSGDAPPGFGCLTLAIIVGYFAWVGFAFSY